MTSFDGKEKEVILETEWVEEPIDSVSFFKLKASVKNSLTSFPVSALSPFSVHNSQSDLTEIQVKY